MLHARDELHTQPNDGDVNLNPWDDIGIDSPTPVTATTPRFAFQNGFSAKARFVSKSSSPSLSPSPKSGLRSRRPGSHRRVSTTDGSLSSHPLQSPALSTSGPLDGAVTRPSLKRRLGSESDFYDSEQGSSEGDPIVNGQQSTKEAEIMVIVHEVSKTDSIAGVALKYGVTLSDLRKANHLWASDPIHLRKVLYIPLHLSSRKRLYYTTNGEDKATNGEASASASTSTSSSVVIQRIPVSQLAFFPPPSHSSLHSERKTYPTIPTPPRIRSDSPGAGTLTSLLQSLPFPLPSRELLFPRLSTDSSETSSTTNASETSSDQDQEHEMSILGTSTSRSRRKRTLSGPRSTRSNFHRNSTTSIETLRKGSKGGVYDDEPMVPLQTEQLKPSPQMELPRSMKKAID